MVGKGGLGHFRWLGDRDGIGWGGLGTNISHPSFAGKAAGFWDLFFFLLLGLIEGWESSEL